MTRRGLDYDAAGWKVIYSTLDDASPAPIAPQLAINAFQGAVQAVYGSHAEGFEQVPFIAAFLRPPEGSTTTLPMYYPRARQQGQTGMVPPHPEGKAYEWFVANDRTARDAAPAAGLRDLAGDPGPAHVGRTPPRQMIGAVTKAKPCDSHSRVTMSIEIMKILFCLLSDQHVPNLLSVHHFKPDRLVLLKSGHEEERRREEPAPALEAGDLDYRGRCHVEPLPDENNLATIRTSIKRAYDGSPQDQWIANITGGTKPMSIAAYEFFKEKSARVIYTPINCPTELLDVENGGIETCRHRPKIREVVAG